MLIFCLYSSAHLRVCRARLCFVCAYLSLLAPAMAYGPPLPLCACTCSEGLDWIVWQARHYGLRVLLVLSSAASPARGGMSQYVRWLDPRGTAHDFYTSDTYRVRHARKSRMARTAQACARTYTHTYTHMHVHTGSKHAVKSPSIHNQVNVHWYQSAAPTPNRHTIKCANTRPSR